MKNLMKTPSRITMEIWPRRNPSVKDNLFYVEKVWSVVKDNLFDFERFW